MFCTRKVDLHIFSLILLIEEKKKQHEMKNEIRYVVFHIPKIWKNLKCFAGSLHQA